MRLFSPASSLLLRPRPATASTKFAPPWTCPQCQIRKTPSPSRIQQHEYSTRSSHRPNRSRRPKRGVLVAAAGAGTLGAGALFFTDEIKHGYAAAERTGRVVSTLAVCINDYRVALKFKGENEAEETSVLNSCHKRCAERTLRVLEKNGSIFIKLGQHLSSMNYLLPPEWTTTFIPLQDQCPVSSYESIEEMFQKDTGGSISDMFEDFEHSPIGAASLAQVHRATLKDGREVAVKVQHPNLEEWMPLDLALTRFTFATLKRFFPEYDLEWLSKEMDYSLPEELDFRMEGANATRAKEYFAKLPQLPVVIPEVISARRRILVMEYLSGHRPDNLEFLDSNHISRDEVSAALSRIFNEMIFGDDAPLHCDPHGGNLAIRCNPSRGRRQNFDVIIYDHGLYRDIPKDLRRNYAKLWLAVIDADEPNMRKYAYEVAGVTDEMFPLFASAITGRDFRVLTSEKGVAGTARDSDEKEDITDAFGDGLLQQLVQMLGKVPRVILLILKTNDLTRSLDENLQTSQGPVRTFLILARYAMRTVYREQLEQIRGIDVKGSLLWPPTHFFRFLSAWIGYMRVELKLELYETMLSLKRLVGQA